MGSFTRVLIPGTEDQYTQIKCGGDQCDSYRVGDDVPYEFYEYRPMCEDFAIESMRIEYWVSGIVSRNRPRPAGGYTVDEVLIEDITTFPRRNT